MTEAVEPGDWPELRTVVGSGWRWRYGAGTLASRAGAAELLAAPLQPCIRDVWHDHVLFVGDDVSGLVDFGAMQPDSVAADIARLLGSLAGDDRQAWTIGLAAYESVQRAYRNPNVR